MPKRKAVCGCEADLDGYIPHHYGCWNEDQTDLEDSVTSATIDKEEE
jgi:hypothetical protein